MTSLGCRPVESRILLIVFSVMPYNEHFPREGRIETICGGMFSGKTEELIRRIKRARIARQEVVIFKPTMIRATAKRRSCRTMRVRSIRNR